MNIVKIDDTLTVSGQISPSDVAQIAAMGFKKILCARPDFEEFGQPKFSEIKAVATEKGLEAIFAPVTMPALPSIEQIAELAKAVETADGPVFGYCKSGRRAAVVWQLANEHLKTSRTAAA